MSTVSASTPSNPLLRLIATIIGWLEAVPYSFIALIARISISAVFWMSGQTKVDGWHLKASTFTLFENDYRLPFLDPTIAAYASAFAEHFFPLLLVLGLASRFAALSLLIMTAI
ncbi:MAG TPA: DoxX family protein, partial [Methylovirgula sp.]